LKCDANQTTVAGESTRSHGFIKKVFDMTEVPTRGWGVGVKVGIRKGRDGGLAGIEKGRGLDRLSQIETQI